MPNWCEGTIKFRGKREDIIRAMTEGLQPIDGAIEDSKIVFDEEYSEPDCLCFTAIQDELFWIGGTYRHFIDFNSKHYTASRFGSDFIIAIPFRAAWGILASAYSDRDGLDNFAKKYHVDVRATGFERGIGFKQTVEVNRNGEVLMDVTDDYGHSYARYMWECEMPSLGG